MSTFPPLLGLPELARAIPRDELQEDGGNQDTQPKHITKFDPEMVPGLAGKRVRFPLSNGRQIVTTSSGYRLIAFDIPAEGLFLSYGPPGSNEGSQFSEPVLLVGDNVEGALSRSMQAVGISLAQGHGILYVAWHDNQGVWLASIAEPDFSSSTHVQQSFAGGRSIELVAHEASLGDIAVDDGGRVILAYTNSTGVQLATLSGHAWRHEHVGDGGSQPVLEFGEDGSLFLAYQSHVNFNFSNREMSSSRIVFTRTNGHSWQPPRIVARGVSFAPSLAVVGNQPLIAFQFEGIKKVGRNDTNYLEEREGGGSSIGFAVESGGKWKTGFISKAEEIIVRDSTVADAFKGRIYPMVEQKWQPKVAIDNHGVAWVFWPDTTRRHTYFSRWLGTCFSDAYEVRGGYYAPSSELTVEKRMPQHTPGLGFAYSAAGRLYVGTVPVPSILPSESRHIVFLDMLEVATVRGLKQELNLFQKRPEPVFTPDSTGSWDDFSVSFPNVNYDRGKFRMDYSGVGTRSGWGEWQQGYAESEDGIHWTRPKLGLISWNGSRENNLIPWVPNFLDDKEPDPEKRYKGVLISGHTRWINDFNRPLAYSPDKIHWKTHGQAIDLPSLLEGGGPSFRDEFDKPERRFKAVGRTISQGHRALGMMWSPDLIHWHGKEAILDVEDPYGKPAELWRGRYVANRILDPSGEKGSDQIYWGNVWIENGIYFCLYAPFQFDGGYQAALAVSRDGFNFMRIKNGQFILPRGDAGEWDSGSIAVGYGAGIPIQLGKKIRVYYGAGTSHHGLEPWRTPWSVGMAELPVDGWVYLTPAPEKASGVLTTIPIPLNSSQPRKLFVNAEFEEGKGNLRVEVLDASTGEVVAGYSEGRCGFHEKDSCAISMAWERGNVLPQKVEKIRLRFHIDGPRTRFYSFWFE